MIVKVSPSGPTDYCGPQYDGRHLRVKKSKKKPHFCGFFSIGMRSSGFEPPRYCYRQPLKLVRLPVGASASSATTAQGKIGPTCRKKGARKKPGTTSQAEPAPRAEQPAVPAKAEPPEPVRQAAPALPEQAPRISAKASKIAPVRSGRRRPWRCSHARSAPCWST
jgi:hypothetical protein